MAKIIWITGISGTGKSTFAKLFQKKTHGYVWIDGDKFRKLFNNDLGYSLKDRDKNAMRLINFVNFLANQKFNVLVSANLTSEKYKKLIRKKFKRLSLIHLVTDIKILKKRDKKDIYTKKKNVVGLDIKDKKSFNKYDYKIINNSKKKDFLKKVEIFINSQYKNKSF